MGTKTEVVGLEDCISLLDDEDVQVMDVRRHAKRAKLAITGSESWQCTACTFLNDHSGDACELCHTTRRPAGTQPPVPPAQSNVAEGSSAADTRYVLDACSCCVDRQEVASHLQQQLDTPSDSLTSLLSQYSCCRVGCNTPVSVRDLLALLGPAALQQVQVRLYQAAFRQAAVVAAGQVGSSLQHLASSSSSSSAAPSLPAPAWPPTTWQPVCPFCQTGLLAVESLPKQKGAVLKGVLLCREQPVPGLVAAKLAAAVQLCSDQAVAFLCVACDLGLLRATGEPVHMSQPDSARRRQEQPAALLQCLRLCIALHRLHALLTTNAPTPAGHSRGRARQGKQRGNSSSRGPKGTGFGGACGYGGESAAQAAARKAAAQRQLQADQQATALLAEARQLVCQAGTVSIALGVCSIVMAGPLASCLRLLLQNDSLMDIGQRRQLYQEVLQLLQTLGAHAELLPLLQRPVCLPSAFQPPVPGSGTPSPPVKQQPGQSGASSNGACPSPASDDKDAPTLLALLAQLDTQARVFQKGAQALGEDGDGEDLQTLCIALDIANTHEQVTKGLAMLQHALQSSPSRAGKGQRGADAEAPAGALQGKRASAASSDATSAQAQYLQQLKPLQYRDVPLLAHGGHYFAQHAAVSKSSGGEAMRRRLRRLAQEHSALSTSLPLDWGSAICVAADSERLDVLRAVVFGPEDTPYANAPFLFDIFLPERYPDEPPKVQLLTTGGGRVRFNPNLYPCGKVCLSLLGTWSGPSWNPADSTLLQVLVSLQSLILVADPYFNEPGYERYMGTQQGDSAAASYAQEIRTHTLQAALLPALRKPDPAFAEVLRCHFKLKHHIIRQQCDRWVQEAEPNQQRVMALAAKEVKAALAAFT